MKNEKWKMKNEKMRLSYYKSNKHYLIKNLKQSIYIIRLKEAILVRITSIWKNSRLINK
jgi:hypothetical protein